MLAFGRKKNLCLNSFCQLRCSCLQSNYCRVCLYPRRRLRAWLTHLTLLLPWHHVCSTDPPQTGQFPNGCSNVRTTWVIFSKTQRLSGLPNSTWLWFGYASVVDAKTDLFVRLWPLASTFEGGRQGPSETPVRIHLAEKIFAASYVQIGQINHLPAVWRPPLTVDARGEQSPREELLASQLLYGQA